MKIEITVGELKELLKKDTPVESTTDAINIDGNKIAITLDGLRNFETTVKDLKDMTVEEINSLKVKDFENKNSAVDGTTTEYEKTIS